MAEKKSLAEKVASYLKTGNRTIADVQEKFDISRDVARRAILNNTPDVVGNRPTGARGRPAVEYRLSA